MKYVSSRRIFEANTDIVDLAKTGWTQEHIDLRFSTENHPAIVDAFEALITSEAKAILENVNVAVSSGEEVRQIWRNAGLPIPYILPDMPAVALQHEKESLVVIDLDVLKNFSKHEQELIFVHELKHLEQISSGRMVMSKNQYIWEGAEYCTSVLVNKTLAGRGMYGAAFMQCMLPWELEAYEAAHEYAVEHGYTETFAYKHKFVIAAAKAVANIRAGGHALPSPFIYDGPVLSREGVFGIGIADKEAVRDSLLNCLSEMVERVGRPIDFLAAETAWAILKVDYELIMAIVLGHGIYTTTHCGFYGDIYKEMPKSYFVEDFVKQMKEIADEGK